MSNAPWGPPPPARPGGSPTPRGNGALIIVLSVGLVIVLVGTIGVVYWVTRPPAGLLSSAPLASAQPSTTVSAFNTPLTQASSTPSSPNAQGPSVGTPTVAQSGPPASQPATAAAPSQPATTAARPTPTQPPSPAPQRPTPNITLKDNSLYKINLSGNGSCAGRVRKPKPPLKNSALAPYLRTVVRCLVDAFRAPLATQGFTLTTPKVKAFKGNISSPCGTLHSHSNPAFYCAGTIYWPVSSDDGNEAYTFARLGYVGLLAHEFGHHLQATTGISYSYGSRYAKANQKARYALSRRLELQAQCFEGVFLDHDQKALKVSSRDRTELRIWHSYTGDEDPPQSRKPDHGTSKEQFAWLAKGLAGADFARCNTWSATARSVS